MHRLGCTNVQKHSLASPAQGVGAAGSNIRADFAEVNVVLHAKFQPGGQTVWPPIRDEHARTHTQTDSRLYYIYFLMETSLTFMMLHLFCFLIYILEKHK